MVKFLEIEDAQLLCQEIFEETGLVIYKESTRVYNKTERKKLPIDFDKYYSELLSIENILVQINTAIELFNTKGNFYVNKYERGLKEDNSLCNMAFLLMGIEPCKGALRLAAICSNIPYRLYGSNMVLLITQAFTKKTVSTKYVRWINSYYFEHLYPGRSRVLTEIEPPMNSLQLDHFIESGGLDDYYGECFPGYHEPGYYDPD